MLIDFSRHVGDFCRVLVDHFPKNHDFSASDPNRLVYVIEAVQKLEINVFREVPRADRFFATFLRFLYGPHRGFSEKS